MPEPTPRSVTKGLGADSQGPLDPTQPRPDTVLVVPPGEPNFAPPQQAGERGTLGRFRVLKRLGQGGMGAVYLGYDDALERKVALKVMLPQYAADAGFRERFLREARAAAKVKNDHVVTIHEVGEAAVGQERRVPPTFGDRFHERVGVRRRSRALEEGGDPHQPVVADAPGAEPAG